MKLIIASNNKHKIREIKQILSDKFDEILSLSEARVDHETVEEGDTFLDNALKKAREISALTGCAVLADDSGLCVNALNGEPGVYSARYAGGRVEHTADADNNAQTASQKTTVPISLSKTPKRFSPQRSRRKISVSKLFESKITQTAAAAANKTDSGRTSFS